MAEWILVPCLARMRTDFNEIAPNRDKASDGSVGDAAHAANSSDHNPDETGTVPIRDADKVNEVHAIDVDASGPWPWDGGMEAAVQHLVARSRAGLEDRLRYVIYNRRIWSASDGWKQRAYSGANPHDHHAHFSASYSTAAEADTHSWHLEDLVALSDADKDFIRALFERGAQPDNGGVTSRIGRDAFDQGIPNGITGVKAPAWAVLRDLGVALRALGDQVGMSTEQLAAAIGQVDEEVIEQLADAGRSDAELAAALQAALGDRAGAVGRLLAGE